VQVTTRRDDTANTPLSLFFGPVLNKPTANLTAVARATIYTGSVTSLQAIPGIRASILPVALDVNVWNTFYTTGKSPDGTIHYGQNGIPQLHVYPWDTNTPGSFALVDVGPPANDVPAFRNWILNGDTPNDISYLLNNNLLPVSPDSPKNWKVGPGMNSTLQTNFQEQMGAPNLIPLFTPYQTSPVYIAAAGQGEGATFAIIGFAGVTVSQADGRGNANMDISLQPMANIDATTVFSNPTPAGTANTNYGSSPTIFLSAKLTY
jgi:hypothetical protein